MLAQLLPGLTAIRLFGLLFCREGAKFADTRDKFLELFEGSVINKQQQQTTETMSSE
jgi:hypothetical protein